MTLDRIHLGIVQVGVHDVPHVLDAGVDVGVGIANVVEPDRPGRLW